MLALPERQKELLSPPPRPRYNSRVLPSVLPAHVDMAVANHCHCEAGAHVGPALAQYDEASTHTRLSYFGPPSALNALMSPCAILLSMGRVSMHDGTATNTQHMGNEN